MQLTLERGCEVADNYPKKRLIDELVLVRRASSDAEDFITRSATGRLTPDLDDAAALCGYADLIRAGYPVKLAGLIISRIRTGMRAYPDADQLVTVTLQNGFSFTMPAGDLDLSSGFSTGGFMTTALLVDVRNYRERVQRAIDAYEPEGEEANEAA